MVSSEVGLGSSRPYWVWIKPGLLGSTAIPGRPLNSEVLKRSRPAVISKGGPDSNTINGLRRTSHFVLTEPPNVMRLCTSVAAGPYSPAKLYGFAGDVLMPSVLLLA